MQGMKAKGKLGKEKTRGREKRGENVKDMKMNSMINILIYITVILCII